jgi:sugar/nucleoside kinase (ribokinase family)
MLSLHAQVVLNTAPAPAERLPAEILAICDIVMPNQGELAMLTDMPTGADHHLHTVPSCNKQVRK